MKLKVSLIISALLTVFSCTAQFKQEVKNVAIFVHEGVELFDFAGPGEVFVAAGYQSPVFNFNVYTVATTEEEVVSQTFLKVVPNYTLDNCPPPDIIVLPGGATNIPLADPKVIEWIQEANQESEITLSVCTGAFLLGKAGLLEGLKATTHWGSIEGLRNSYPNTEVLEETKYIDNGKIITSGGVSSGTEGSLHVIDRIAGRIAAKNVARYMEYNGWDDRVGLVEKEGEFISAVKKDGLDKALASMGSNSMFYGEVFNLALDYMDEGKTNEALPILEFLVDKYPVSETYEVLGKAHKELGKPAPINQSELLSMFKEGKIDEGIKRYTDSRKKFPKWYIFGQWKLNMAGYHLMNEKRFDDAIKVFTVVTQEYPESSNAWDSLGEAYLKSGNNKLARKYYSKALELNPESQTAKEALASLD